MFPSDNDPRSGSVDLAHIPGFVTRSGVERDRPWPWLRLSVNDAVVLLDEGQVRQIRDYLTTWLEGELE